MSKLYFIADETPYHPGKSMIWPVHSNLPLYGTKGSYGLLAARLLNLSYANYLRMCRDLYGAEIIGKNTMYPIALFDNGSEKLKELVNLLNKRTECVLKNKGV